MKGSCGRLRKKDSERKIVKEKLFKKDFEDSCKRKFAKINIVRVD